MTPKMSQTLGGVAAFVLAVALAVAAFSDRNSALKAGVTKDAHGVVFSFADKLFAATPPSWRVARLPASFDNVACPAWSSDFRFVADLDTGSVVTAGGTRRWEHDYPLSWAPKGAEFAFFDSYQNAIKVGSPGSTLRTVARGALPTWSTDGHIYFDADLAGDTRGVEPATGLIERVPSDGDGWFIHGKWSSAGMVAYTGQNEEGLFVSRRGEFHEPRLVTSAFLTAYAWSPNGELMAFVTEEKLILVRLDDGREKEVAELDAEEMSWSPTGDWLVLERARGIADPVTGDSAREIWVVRPDGTGLQRIGDRQLVGEGYRCASWVPLRLVNTWLRRTG